MAKPIVVCPAVLPCPVLDCKLAKAHPAPGDIVPGIIPCNRALAACVIDCAAADRYIERIGYQFTALINAVGDKNFNISRHRLFPPEQKALGYRGPPLAARGEQEVDQPLPAKLVGIVIIAGKQKAWELSAAYMPGLLEPGKINTEKPFAQITLGVAGGVGYRGIKPVENLKQPSAVVKKNGAPHDEHVPIVLAAAGEIGVHRLCKLGICLQDNLPYALQIRAALARVVGIALIDRDPCVFPDRRNDIHLRG